MTEREVEVMDLLIGRIALIELGLGALLVLGAVLVGAVLWLGEVLVAEWAQEGSCQGSRAAPRSLPSAPTRPLEPR